MTRHARFRVVACIESFNEASLETRHLPARHYKKARDPKP